jgi:hypothetical protein
MRERINDFLGKRNRFTNADQVQYGMVKIFVFILFSAFVRELYKHHPSEPHKIHFGLQLAADIFNEQKKEQQGKYNEVF